MRLPLLNGIPRKVYPELVEGLGMTALSAVTSSRTARKHGAQAWALRNSYRPSAALFSSPNGTAAGPLYREYDV
jgi:hypothetical protein